jgi:uncharacterized protein (TIGR00369 family)
MGNSNPIVEALKKYINKPFSVSPSPFTYWLRPVIREVEVGRVVFEYEIRHEMTNPIHTLHGGVIAGIIDDTIGAALYTIAGENTYSTVNLGVDYFYPAREKDKVLVEAVVVKKGKQIVHINCKITHKQTGKLLAEGRSNLIKMGLSGFKNIPER